MCWCTPSLRTPCCGRLDCIPSRSAPEHLPVIPGNQAPSADGAVAICEERMKHPIQPIFIDSGGRKRFSPNKIVEYLLDNGGIDLNKLASLDFCNDDRQQFAQLIGYSLSGYGELSYVDNLAYEAAEAMSDDATRKELQVRIDILESQLGSLREALRAPMVELFDVHPDDLGGDES